MTAMPYPGRLLTIRDYAALPEDDRQRGELLAGNVIPSPRRTPHHMIALGGLFAQLRTQLPHDYRVIVDVDVDMQLADASQPGTSRRPDLVVVPQAEVDRVRFEGGLLQAGAVSLVVEIISPGSRRTDQVIKRSEYADAGIPHYWIIDPEPTAGLTAFHLAGDFGYVEESPVFGQVDIADPFRVALDLTALR